MSWTKRASPFESELKAMPKNTRYGQYFPWSILKQDYDLSKFDSALCDECITENELNQVFEKLRKNSYYSADYIPFACWIIPFVITTLIITIAIINQFRLTVVLRRLILVCFALLLILPITLMAIAKRVARNRNPKRVDKLKRELRDLQLRTLNNKDVELRISNLGSYIVLDTSKCVWRRNSVNPAGSLRRLAHGQSNPEEIFTSIR